MPDIVASGDHAPTTSDDVFDWDIAPTTMAAVTEQLRLPSDHPRLVMTVNTSTLHLGTVDREVGRICRDADLRVVDGMGVVWAWRILGRRLPERVAGIDLMMSLIAAAADDGRSIYLLGARQEVIDRLQVVLRERFPALRVAGSRNGYFGEDDHEAVVADIAASGADLLFIGMPSPFKELWAARHLDEFGCDLVLGVGGSFDVVAGFVPRAPAPMQRLGLEWAWRLACEPRRMWKRYAVTNAWLARQVAVRLLRRRGRRSAVQPAGAATGSGRMGPADLADGSVNSVASRRASVIESNSSRTVR